MKWYLIYKNNFIRNRESYSVSITNLNTSLIACRSVILEAKYAFPEKSNSCKWGKYYLSKVIKLGMLIALIIDSNASVFMCIVASDRNIGHAIFLIYMCYFY